MKAWCARKQKCCSKKMKAWVLNLSFSHILTILSTSMKAQWTEKIQWLLKFTKTESSMFRLSGRECLERTLNRKTRKTKSNKILETSRRNLVLQASYRLQMQIQNLWRERQLALEMLSLNQIWNQLVLQTKRSKTKENCPLKEI